MLDAAAKAAQDSKVMKTPFNIGRSSHAGSGASAGIWPLSIVKIRDYPIFLEVR
jgi:hypothetical protein